MFLTSLFSSLISSIPGAVSRLVQTSFSHVAKSIHSSPQTTGPEQDEKKMAVEGSGVIEATTTFVTSTLITYIFFIILPVFLATFQSLFENVHNIFQEWIDDTFVETEDGAYYRVKRFLWWFFRLIPVVIDSFVHRFLLVLFTYGFLIIMGVMVVFVFSYLLEWHRVEFLLTINMLSDIVVDIYNLLGGILQVMAEIRSLFAPLTNTATREMMFVCLHIYDGMEFSLQAFGARRLAIVYGDSLGQVFEELILIYETVSDVYLQVVLTVIDIFFHTGMLLVIDALTDIFQVLATKSLCAVAGQYCAFLELFNYLVYNVLFSFFELFCLGLCSLPTSNDIACSSNQLASFGIYSECAGNFFSVDPPGLYVNAGPRTNSRTLLQCYQENQTYIESYGDTILHTTLHEPDSCPHVTRGFNPHGNALNMKLLDTHDCYYICYSQDVLVKKCINGESFVGTCPWGTPLPWYHQKVRRLRISMNRGDMINGFKKNVGANSFDTSIGSCDLSFAPGSIHDVIVDASCLFTKLMERGRGVKKGNTKSKKGGKRRQMISMISNMRHNIRIKSTVNRNVSRHFRDALSYYRLRPPIQISRRRMEDTPMCPGTQSLCPNGMQCVANIQLCKGSTSYSPLGWIRQGLSSIINGVENFDVVTEVQNVLTCWRNYETNPQTDPYDLANLLDPTGAADREVWCIPMLQPKVFTFTPSTFSFKTWLLSNCVAESPSFGSCQCPMFIEYLSADVTFIQHVNEDLMLILYNGWTWFKTLFIFIIGDGIGYFWRSLFPAPTFSTSISNYFNLYPGVTADEYLICMGLNVGSAGLFILVMMFLIQVLKFLYDITSFIRNNGKTNDEVYYVSRLKTFSETHDFSEMIEKSLLRKKIH